MKILRLSFLLMSGVTLAIFVMPIVAQQKNDGIPYPALGRLVEAGGHRLHRFCTGKGGPTVVIENGTGDFSFDWSLVQPSVTKFTRICTYDRAGYAWSESGPEPRTFQQITTELHTALHNAGIKGPFLMVGQSYGGFPARSFARYYPKEVVGMVLVDAVNEDSRVIIGGKPARIREFAKGRPFAAPQKDLPKIARKDLAKSDSQTSSRETKLESPLDKLPPGIQKIRLWAQVQSDYKKAQSAELDWSPEELAQMYANRGKPEYMLGDIPLIVLTRTNGGYSDYPGATAQELEEERLRLQTEMAHLSSDGKLIIAKNSGHNIHLEDAELVVDAIRQVLDAVRH